MSELQIVFYIFAHLFFIVFMEMFTRRSELKRLREDIRRLEKENRENYWKRWKNE